MNKQKRAVVIGGGLAGLSAAIKLQSEGFQTTLFEKNDYSGGKLKEVVLGTHHFDFGPNTITMPHVFRNVLIEAGENPDDYFQFIKLTTHTKNEFPDGSHLFFSSDKEEMTEELNRLDSYSAAKYNDYLNEVKKLYQLAENHFLNRTFSSWKDYLSLPLAKAMSSSRPLESLDRFHRRYFKDERIIKAFNRYATYIGSSPFNAPATFALIGHLEMGDGVYFTKGGNHQIALGFEKAAQKLGVDICKGEEVVKCIAKDGKIKAVETAEGKVLEAEAFVLNGDLLTQYPRLVEEKERPSLPDGKFNQYEPSISAFVILAALSERYNVHHHHVYFGDRTREEFETIFQDGQYGIDPTIYICTSSKTDPSLSPVGDNMFILVNAPPLANKGSAPESSMLEEKIYKLLSNRGLPIKDSLIQSETVSPRDIAKRFYAYRGALYGIASNRKKDTFLRPYNRSQDLSNLFFAGGSTHPGGGSPMVVLSGRNAARLIIEEF
ncbi:phytoene desaturase family protein [Salipaludibacillus aurantiacus]|uniref:4,4'-diaponeurosporene oxygenase n=1 Tax=Salipaludibacillus aurantiacus TaxID=1601833 RepID=A0A1H9PH16_9BACI|nr:phytoene desaturase family protein [Salipaludibacillus aurantiacus]SER47159.1 phytoene desaturase [Salipaludibacillus aurantiacus]